VATTTPHIQQEALDLTRSLVRQVKTGLKTIVAGAGETETLVKMVLPEGGQTPGSFEKLQGYSGVRNACLFLPWVSGSETAVLIDDDEVFDDPGFMARASKFIGKKYRGEVVEAVAGYYLQPEGGYRITRKPEAWMKNWGQYESMNRAFRLIASGRQLKKTPFVFGGNMVVHRNVFSQVPFDPLITRGEDIDYLINARMFGHYFFLDNRLAVKHLPPPKAHPAWMQLRQDIFRFIYQKKKIDRQKELPGMTRVAASDLDPYPGDFLKSDLMQKIRSTCLLLAEKYLEEGDREGYDQALASIEIARAKAAEDLDPFEHLLHIQRNWQALMQRAGDNLRARQALQQ
jgi:hypothetical protein